MVWEGPTGTSGWAMEDDSGCNSTGGGVIPFFGSADDDTMSKSWSHLNHRIEEYRHDLVKVVESLDIIINNLESAAAKATVGPEDRGLPGEGVHGLAAKLRRKLHKTPPRWQVNLDVLSWLLRPVPFVAGLPAPLPPAATLTPLEATHGDTDGTSIGDKPPARDRVGGDVFPGDGASDAHGAEEIVQTQGSRPAKVAPRGDAVGKDPSVAGSAPAEETRAVPVPVPRFQRAEDGGGSEGTQVPKNRAGFHSYDETHQIFTHILRDWTSEGDSVRAAVYNPLLEALDAYIGSRRSGERDYTAGSDVGGGGGDNRSGSERDQPEPRGSDTPMANVLIPGAGLGRLAVEVAATGYASVHANELSTTMLSSCYWLMEALRGTDFAGKQASPTGGENEDDHPVSPSHTAHYMPGRDSGSTDCGDTDSGGGDDEGEFEKDCSRRRGANRTRSFEFYPFLNDAAVNEMDGEARFRSVLFPDPAGRAVLARASGRLSFQAGEFSATYGGLGGPYDSFFDAVVTSFFVDTAPNVVQYVATIRRALKPGGVWINCGPLHWHNHSALALSLDEMLVLVAGSGFRLEGVRQLPPSAYRVDDGGGSLRVDEFRPIFWVAVLDDGPPR
eukprot:g3745.t1